MNISEQVNRFQPGTTMTREEFTPEVQNEIVNDYFGAPKSEPTQPAIPDGHVSISQQELDALKTENENFRTVFTAPGVSERIGDIITGRTTNSTAPAQQAAPPQGSNPQVQQPVPDYNTSTANQAVQNPQPSQQQNEVAGAGSDFDGLFGMNGPEANDASQSIDNQMNDVNGVQGNQSQVQQPQNQQAQQTQQAQVDPASEYANAVAAEALKAGIRPDEVLQFVGGLTPAQAVALYKNSQGEQQVQAEQPAPQPNINLAEERPPDGPIKQYTGIGGPVPWRGLKV